MAKVVFVQQTLFEYLGPMCLSAFLKKYGHEVDIYVGGVDKPLLDSIRNSEPDIVAFSCTTGNHLWARDIARSLKETMDILTIVGGPHPTFFPELINDAGVDIICRGEGEHALLELADCIDKRKDFTTIKNLWVKKAGKVYKNDLRPLIEDLDTLPFPDRDLYSKYAPLDKMTLKKFMTSRGCPYSCSFCFNHALKKIYNDKGRYVRRRSVENVISEIETVKEKCNLKIVRFSDDTFTTDHKWLFEFAGQYKKRIQIPYTCLIRANEINEHVVKSLSESGCMLVTFGIETGNEKLRKDILKKNIPNSQIINTGRLLKKYHILFGTSNMVGLPTETLDNIFETLDINIKIGTDLPTCAILQPYLGTQILEFAQSGGLIEDNWDVENLNADVFNKWNTNVSVIKSDHKREMFNIHKLFYFYIKFPLLRAIIRRLIRLPPNNLYSVLYRLGWGYRVKKSLGLSWLETLGYGFRLTRDWMS